MLPWCTAMHDGKVNGNKKILGTESKNYKHTWYYVICFAVIIHSLN